MKEIQIKPAVIIEYDPTNWVFGANSLLGDVVEVLSSGDWRPFLPTNERQNAVYFDTQGCVTFSALNCIETILNFKRSKGELPQAMLDEFRAAGYFDADDRFNFSDRYIAKLSGTTRQGNSLNRVAEAIRKYGLVPQKLWDFPTEQRTPVFDWDDFYSEVPQSVIDVGQKVFLKWVKVNWEWILQGVTSPTYAMNQLQAHLKEAPIQIATAVCPGWNEGGETPVPRCEQPIAHAHMIAHAEAFYHDLDSYNPFLKMLAGNYNIPWGLKYVLTIMPGTNEIHPTEGVGKLLKVVDKPAVFMYGLDRQWHGLGDMDVLKVFKGAYDPKTVLRVPSLPDNVGFTITRQEFVRPAKGLTITIVDALLNLFNKK